MKPKDILGLVVRLLGVLFLYRAVEAVPMVWRVVSMGSRAFNWSLFFDSILIVAWQGAVAWWLIKGAPPVMNWAYPVENKGQ
jgi:hypothetical protein